jgi:fumarate hydratase subunit alpha
MDKTFSQKRLEDIVEKLVEKSVIETPRDVSKALKKALETEDDDTARMQISAILSNIVIAREKHTPLCQDTGIPLFYINVGGRVKLDINELNNAVNRGVAKATRSIPLRPNVVDPISRKNTKDNTGECMPHVSLACKPNADYVELTVMPKGAGSENMSALRMLKPSEGVTGIKKFVLETVAKASGNPCPPTIIGVGIGGSSDIAMALAKKASMRKIGVGHSEHAVRKLEEELKDEVNRLGVGPMGLGGRTTCLAVHIEKAGCHTASLPVGVNMQCWTGRRATVRVYKDRVRWLT